ncbi:MAG TPA: pyridoxal-dependent decarboxylase [Pirellulales bacterium]
MARFTASPDTPSLNVPSRPDAAGFAGARESAMPDAAGSRSIAAWFLGVKGENAEELERLVVEAVRDQAYWRRNYHPGDPAHITAEVKRSPQYLQAADALREGYQGLLAFLKKSVPFFSMRYQGHMNWDLTLPGIAGYFAAMLYNPNNVAFEGSTATTFLELIVGDDLCRMLGYKLPTDAEIDAGAIRPWGHIACDGTVANIEAVWAARNLKLYPLALQAALMTEPLAAAHGIEIALPTGGTARVVELSTWQLLNLSADAVLALPARLTAEFKIPVATISAEVGKFTLQALGWLEFGRRFLNDVPAPVFTVPGSKHYSFPKAAAVLGFGNDHLLNIAVDADARQSVAVLKQKLQECLDEKRPVVAVVAVIGTTEESSIDPLKEIINLRDYFAKKGLTFHVHADAAWGGYHRSVINDEFDMPQPERFAETTPLAAPLSQYVVEQFEVLGYADSITVDPHKSGYIPYPAGALCYRNAAMRDLVTFSAPVVFHGEAEPTVGIYGIEGSKPGAAAAAVYLSHRVIRPTRSGYGQIIGQALLSCRKFYARLLAMDEPHHRFKAVPVARLPAERAGQDPAAQRQDVLQLIDRRTTAEIQSDPDALALLREIGPDQNILSYSFNFYHADGQLNADLNALNELNQAIYNRLSIDPGDDINGYPLVVSTTDVDESAYGPEFIQEFKQRLGVGGSPGGKITLIRSVVMDPWVTDTPKGSFIDVLEIELRRAVVAVLEELSRCRTGGY